MAHARYNLKIDEKADEELDEKVFRRMMEKVYRTNITGNCAVDLYDINGVAVQIGGDCVVIISKNEKDIDNTKSKLEERLYFKLERIG